MSGVVLPAEAGSHAIDLFSDLAQLDPELAVKVVRDLTLRAQS